MHSSLGRKLEVANYHRFHTFVALSRGERNQDWGGGVGGGTVQVWDLQIKTLMTVGIII